MNKRKRANRGKTWYRLSHGISVLRRETGSNAGSHSVTKPVDTSSRADGRGSIGFDARTERSTRKWTSEEKVARCFAERPFAPRDKYLSAKWAVAVFALLTCVAGFAWTPTLAAQPRATISIVEFNRKTYRPGATVAVEVNVTNTGSERKRVYVGYSVKQPNGKWIDARDKTGVLNPGQSAKTTLSCKLPSNAQLGSYDLTVAVWSGKMNGRLTGELDRETRDGAFEVNRLSKVTVYIKNTDDDPVRIRIKVNGYEREYSITPGKTRRVVLRPRYGAFRLEMLYLDPDIGHWSPICDTIQGTISKPSYTVKRTVRRTVSPTSESSPTNGSGSRRPSRIRVSCDVMGLVADFMYDLTVGEVLSSVYPVTSIVKPTRDNPLGILTVAIDSVTFPARVMVAGTYKSVDVTFKLLEFAGHAYTISSRCKCEVVR